MDRGCSSSPKAYLVTLGAREKGVEAENDPGHAWVAFGPSDRQMEFRGYYPIIPGIDFSKIKERSNVELLDNIAEEFDVLFSSIRQFVEYFLENEVDGTMLRDPISFAVSGASEDNIDRDDEEYKALLETIARNRRPKKMPFFAKDISIQQHCYRKMANACHIPDGLDAVIKGRYGLRVDKEGVNNCVSWAVRTIKNCISEMPEIPTNTYSIRELVGWITPSGERSTPSENG